MKRLTQITAIAVLAATPVIAEMGDHDSDGDAMLNDAEFGQADGSRRFTEYDSDGSGDLSEEEFAKGEFNRYDRDRDSMINDEEYSRYEEDGEMENDG